MKNSLLISIFVSIVGLISIQPAYAERKISITLMNVGTNEIGTIIIPFNDDTKISAATVIQSLRPSFESFPSKYDLYTKEGELIDSGSSQIADNELLFTYLDKPEASNPHPARRTSWYDNREHALPANYRVTDFGLEVSPSIDMQTNNSAQSCSLTNKQMNRLGMGLFVVILLGIGTVIKCI